MQVSFIIYHCTAEHDIIDRKLQLVTVSKSHKSKKRIEKCLTRLGLEHTTPELEEGHLNHWMNVICDEFSFSWLNMNYAVSFIIYHWTAEHDMIDRKLQSGTVLKRHKSKERIEKCTSTLGLEPRTAGLEEGHLHHWTATIA